MAAELERVLAFDLVGPMAHFRKFYANSSSLSYSLPPRTALAGVIAASLGWKRDDYYEALSLDRARIGVALKTPVRKIVQTVNYLFTKGWVLYQNGQGTQIPLELVLPGPPAEVIRYRVYLAHADQDVLRELDETLGEERYRYPLYLGLTECPARVERPRLYGPGELDVQEDPSEPVAVATAVPVERVGEGMVLEDGIRLYKDRMPLDFDGDRRLKAVGEVLWEAGGSPVTLRLTGTVFRPPGEPAWCTFLE